MQIPRTRRKGKERESRQIYSNAALRFPASFSFFLGGLKSGENNLFHFSFRFLSRRKKKATAVHYKFRSAEQQGWTVHFNLPQTFFWGGDTLVSLPLFAGLEFPFQHLYSDKSSHHVRSKKPPKKRKFDSPLLFPPFP